MCLPSLLLPTVPDAPRSFTVSEIYADALRVSWDRPLRLNGVLIAYLVTHWRNDTLPSNGQTTRLSNTTLSHTVTGLRANTAYGVKVSAETRVGPGTSKNLVATTTQSPGKTGVLLFVHQYSLPTDPLFCHEFVEIASLGKS